MQPFELLLVCAVSLLTTSGVQPPIPPVRVITSDDVKTFREVAEGTREPSAMSETNKQHMDAMRARYLALAESVEGVPTLAMASRLENDLYHDVGMPYLNGRFQEMVVDLIGRTASRPDTPSEVADAMRSVLMSYSSAGGAAAGPLEQLSLARAMAVVGGPDHPEFDQAAMALCDRADQFAASLQYDLYYELGAPDRDDIKKVVAWKNGLMSDWSQAPKGIRRALADLDAGLRAMSLEETCTTDHVVRATRAATHVDLTGTMGEDALSRLLEAFRLVLTRRKGAAKSVVQAIDAKLLWLAKDTRKLTTPEHWTLWGEAVAALRNRSSKDIENFLRETIKRPPHVQAEKAAKVAVDGLKKS